MTKISQRAQAFARLAAVIEAERRAANAFGAALVAWLRTQVAFDHLVAFAYRGQSRPVLVAETFTPAESHVYVTLYQEGPYLLDPFFHAAVEGRQGFWRMRELAPDRFFASEYYRSYYTQTALAEEVGFFVSLDAETSVVVSLMRRVDHGAFGAAEIRLLRDLAPVVLALCGRQWRALAETGWRAPASRQAIGAKSGSRPFADNLDLPLTPKEFQIVELVLRGLSTAAIARHLGMAAGTVKVHRRNVYRKLGIGSQAGLFAKFTAAMSGGAPFPALPDVR